MPAWMMGNSMPNSSVMRVLSMADLLPNRLSKALYQK
jgi:hypothetical protein